MWQQMLRYLYRSQHAVARSRRAEVVIFVADYPSQHSDRVTGDGAFLKKLRASTLRVIACFWLRPHHSIPEEDGLCFLDTVVIRL